MSPAAVGDFLYKEVEKMWTKEIFGTQFLIIMECFIGYSFLGWCVESLYMSFCNRKWTNRGFIFGPFCPIYGFGAVIGNFLMHPLSDHLIALYLTSAIGATVFEYLVGILMEHYLHEVWWDYTEKPFNYKGIICLESTLAWGFYGIIVIRYLNTKMVATAEIIPADIARRLCILVAIYYLMDFLYHLIEAMGYDMKALRHKAALKAMDKAGGAYGYVKNSAGHAYDHVKNSADHARGRVKSAYEHWVEFCEKWI